MPVILRHKITIDATTPWGAREAVKVALRTLDDFEDGNDHSHYRRPNLWTCEDHEEVQFASWMTKTGVVVRQLDDT